MATLKIISYSAILGHLIPFKLAHIGSNQGESGSRYERGIDQYVSGMGEEMRTIFCVFCVCLVSWNVSAQEVDVSNFKTGNKLYKDCAENYRHCVGYVQGVVDGASAIMAELSMKTPICFPNNVTSGQVTDIVIKYLKENPSARHYVAASNVMVAITNAFPCPDVAKDLCGKWVK